LAGQNGALSAIGIDETGRLLPPTAAAPFGISCTGGRTPRDFVLVRRAGGRKEKSGGQVVALVANQDSGCVTAIPLTGEEGMPALVARVPTPACLCVPPEDAILGEVPCSFLGEPLLTVAAAAAGVVRGFAVAGGVAVAGVLLLAAVRAWARK
jgi:hypothetical protein